MNDVMVIIDDSHKKKDMEKIIDKRSFGSMPFGSKFRLIDFTLSNISFSGIKNVGIFIKGDSRSLINHLHGGKEWGLLRNRDGLFILSSCLECVEEKPFANMKNLYCNMDYLERSEEEYVLLCSSNVIYNMDIKLIKKYFVESKSDVVLLYSEEVNPITKEFINFKVDWDNSVINYQIINKIANEKYNRNMDMIFLRKTLLMAMIKEAQKKGEKALLIDFIVRKNKEIKVTGLKYGGYVVFIDDYLSYYKYSKDLLKPNIRKELFFGVNEIITTRNDQGPTKYLKGSKVKNSLITEGCIIEGEVENSILFRGVKVEKGAKVRNAVIMHKTTIGEGAIVEHAILDKDVVVKAKRVIKGDENKPKVIKKKSYL